MLWQHMLLWATGLFEPRGRAALYAKPRCWAARGVPQHQHSGRFGATPGLALPARLRQPRRERQQLGGRRPGRRQRVAPWAGQRQQRQGLEGP